MLEHETVDADGVLLSEPLALAYARAWGKVMGYPERGSSDQFAYYGNSRILAKDYYAREVVAGPTSVSLSNGKWKMQVVLMQEPVRGGRDCSVGMWGEPMSGDQMDSLLMAVSTLPYSAKVASAIIDRADWLDENPMYRGLPGVASRHTTPGQSADEDQPKRPKDWD